MEMGEGARSSPSETPVRPKPRFAASGNDMQMDTWPQFFTADALYHVTTRGNYEAGLPIGIVRCLGREC